MTEGLFILTTIFVAYVIYQIIGEQNATAKSKAPSGKPENQAVAVEQPKPQVAIAEAKPAAPKPAPAKTVAPKAAATKAEPSKPSADKPTAAKTAEAKTTAKKATTVTAQSTGLKDPKTGEVTTSYSNYRFTKRWIKDALVAEGLLEKVYSGNELNADIEAKIKAAITQLEAIDKYKA